MYFCVQKTQKWLNFHGTVHVTDWCYVLLLHYTVIFCTSLLRCEQYLLLNSQVVRGKQNECGSKRRTLCTLSANRWNCTEHLCYLRCQWWFVYIGRDSTTVPKKRPAYAKGNWKLHFDNCHVRAADTVTQFLLGEVSELYLIQPTVQISHWTTFTCTLPWKGCSKDAIFQPYRLSLQRFIPNCYVCPRMVLRMCLRSGKSVGTSACLWMGTTSNTYVIWSFDFV